jgi:hypothetical protein
MGANLRASWGAICFVRRTTLLKNENVYSRAVDKLAKIFLNGRVFVRFPRRARFAEANPPFRSIPLHRRETKRCNDIA